MAEFMTFEVLHDLKTFCTYLQARQHGLPLRKQMDHLVRHIGLEVGDTAGAAEWKAIITERKYLLRWWGERKREALRAAWLVCPLLYLPPPLVKLWIGF